MTEAVPVRPQASTAPLKEAVCCVLYHPTTQAILGVSRGVGSSEWALVGGKVDPGETFEQAMVREAMEETGVEIFNLRRVYDAVSDGPNPHHTTAFVAEWRGTPRSSEEGDVKWVRWEDILSGPFGQYGFRLLQRLVLP